MKHTKQQIGESICRWSAYLLENNLASKEEIDEILNESIFKRAKAKIAGGLSKFGKGLSSVTKKIKNTVHDEFAANPGVKEMMKNIKEMITKDDYELKDIKFYVFVKSLKQTFPVADFVFSQNRKTLALMFKDKRVKPKTAEDLIDAMDKAGIRGEKVKLSDFTDSLVVGQLKDGNGDTIVFESVKSSEIERIGKVVKAMNWSKSTALKPKSLQKLATLFGIGGDTAASDVKEVVKQYFETQSSSPTADNVEPQSADDTSSSSDEEVPDFTQDNTPKGPNDEVLKTKNGDIGVMSSPFVEVRTQNNKIGIIFGAKKDDDDKKARMKKAMDV